MTDDQTPKPITKDLAKAVRGPWVEFLLIVEPLRQDLFQYCRSLARNVWDAEDLVQDTLLRAHGKLGVTFNVVENPRAWLFRVATNLWLDQQRRAGVVMSDASPPEKAADQAPSRDGEIREALGLLARKLPPQERAAVLLKDVFDFSLDDTATFLGVSTGAIKSALHRGRERLHQKLPGERAPVTAAKGPSDKALDAFVKAFNARDLHGLANLFTADAEAEVVGMVYELGRDKIRDGSLRHTVAEENNPMVERQVFEGEPLLVMYYDVKDDGKTSRAVGDVLRFEEGEHGITRLRYYYFCPQTLREVGHALGLPVSDNGYHY